MLIGLALNRVILLIAFRVIHEHVISTIPASPRASCRTANLLAGTTNLLCLGSRHAHGINSTYGIDSTYRKAQGHSGTDNQGANN